MASITAAQRIFPCPTDNAVSLDGAVLAADPRKRDTDLQLCVPQRPAGMISFICSDSIVTNAVLNSGHILFYRKQTDQGEICSHCAMESKMKAFIYLEASQDISSGNKGWLGKGTPEAEVVKAPGFW